MPDFIHCIVDNFGNPLVLDFINPSIVVVIDGHFQIRNLVGNVPFFPFINISQSDLALFSALVSDIFLNEFLNQVDWVSCEKILRWLSRGYCSK